MKSVETPSERPIVVPALPSQPVTPWQLLNCVRARWMPAAVLGTVTALVAFALVYTFLPPSKPQAFTRLYFPPRPTQGVLASNDPPMNQQTQKELVLSRLVLVNALANPRVAELPVVSAKAEPFAWLSRQLSVEFPPGSEIMRIGLTGENGDEIATIVDVVKDSYLTQIFQKSADMRDARQGKVRDGYLAAEAAVEKLKKEYRTAVNEAGASDSVVLATRQEGVEKDLVLVREQLFQVQLDIKAMEEAEVEAANDPKRSSEAANAPREFDPEEIRLLRYQRQIAESNLRDKSKVYAVDHPSVVDAKESLRLAEQKLNEAGVSGGGRDLMTLGEVRVRLSKLRNDETKLQTRETRLTTNAGKLKDAALEVSLVKDRLRDAEATVREYTSTMSRSLIDLGETDRVQILDPVTVIPPNDGPRRMRMGLLAAIAFGGMAVGLIGLLEYRKGRLTRLDELEQLGLTPLAAVPVGAPAARLVVAGQAVSRDELVAEEAIDALRAHLAHRADRDPSMRLVQVTSAEPGEGATSVALRLASSLARSGMKTLLADGDFRRPTLHDKLKLPLTPGMGEALREPLDLWTLIKDAGAPNLYFLPAGRFDAVSYEQMAHFGLMRVLEELRHAFDFVVFDSGPILASADGLILARQCDAVIVSAEYGRTELARVRLALQRLAEVQVAPIGAVIGGAPARALHDRPLLISVHLFRGRIVSPEDHHGQ